MSERGVVVADSSPLISLSSVGQLPLAKVRGHVGALRPIVENLLAHGFRLDDAVVERLLREVGER